MTDDRKIREESARAHVRRVLERYPKFFSKEGNRQFYRACLEQEDPRFLVLAAREGYADAVEVLRDYARGARKAGMNVPTELHEFVWEWFIDGPPKAKPGIKPTDVGRRNLTIALLVKIVWKDYGFSVYRNPEHRGQKTGPMCACLLVAQEVGLEESTVEKIWEEWRDSVMRPR